MQPKALVILAAQRSGTNFLRSLLSNTGSFSDMNEIFHVQGSLQQSAPFTNYLAYSRDQIQQDPSLAAPDYNQASELFRKYLQQLEAQIPDSAIPLLDVKYNSTHQLNPVFCNPLEPPHFFKVVRELKLPLIHLVRENLLARYASAVVAEATKTFVLYENKPPAPPRLQINISDMMRDLERVRSEIEWGRATLKDYGRCLEISYEAISEDADNPLGQIKAALEKLTGVALPDKLHASTTRLIPSVSAVVQNTDEVRLALLGTEFESMLHILDEKSVP